MFLTVSKTLYNYHNTNITLLIILHIRAYCTYLHCPSLLVSTLTIPSSVKCVSVCVVLDRHMMGQLTLGSIGGVVLL